MRAFRDVRLLAREAAAGCHEGDSRRHDGNRPAQLWQCNPELNHAAANERDPRRRCYARRPSSTRAPVTSLNSVGPRGSARPAAVEVLDARDLSETHSAA